MSSDEGESTIPDSSENTFKILLATDIHLGFENRTKRAKDRDSFVTFEEILQLAQDNEVDFILLGGDLFHECRPPQPVLLNCFNLLKKYCMGSRPMEIQFLSDPEQIFSQSEHKMINYEDENLNVSMPIFSIHGNHDNPNLDNTGAMDLLMASGLVNYFGKWSNLQKIDVLPLIFKKGDSHVAIYGLGHINEPRLIRMMREGRVMFIKPTVPNCFCICVVHQNRAKHAEDQYIDEDRFPSWFDMIFWGHEHECRIVPEYTAAREGGNYVIVQPGSSIATSCSAGEAIEKKVGLLLTEGRKYKLKPLKLQTVRPFVFDDLVISTAIEKGYCDLNREGIRDYVDSYIETVMLEKARALLTGHEMQPKEPMLRLRIFYNRPLHIFETMDLERKYHDIVANPKDIFLFKREREPGVPRAKKDDDLTEELAECFREEIVDRTNPEEWERTVHRRLKMIFDKKNFKMKILSLPGLNEALRRFTVANDREAFPQVAEHQLKKSLDYLFPKVEDENDNDFIDREIEKYRLARAKKYGEADDTEEVQAMLDDPVQRDHLRNGLYEHEDPYGNDAPITGRGRGRGSRGGGTRARGRGRGARGRGKTVEKSPAKLGDIHEMLNLQRFTSQRKDPPASTSKDQRTSYFIPSDSDD